MAGFGDAWGVGFGDGSTDPGGGGTPPEFAPYLPAPIIGRLIPGVDIPRIDVYNHAFVLQGQVARPLSLNVVDAFKAAGSCTVSVAGELDSEIAAAFEDPGCRVVVTLRNTVIFSGPRSSVQWVGPESAPTVTATFVDDYAVLLDILAWPIPANALTAQSTARWTSTGALENVVKDLIRANVAAARLNLPITVETNGGHGATVTVSARMQPVSDYIQPLLDQYGKGLKARQSGSGITISWVEPVTYPETLSEVGGQIVHGGWELTETSPTVTRAIVGGSGEGTAREFVQRTDATAETALGWKRERFVDARDTNVTADLNARGDAAIAEGSAKLSARIPLQETDEFQCYGTGGLKPGDLVPIALMGRTWTDFVSTISTTFDAQNGLVVEPIAGGLESRASAVDAKRIATLQRRVRAIEASK